MYIYVYTIHRTYIHMPRKKKMPLEDAPPVVPVPAVTEPAPTPAKPRRVLTPEALLRMKAAKDRKKREREEEKQRLALSETEEEMIAPPGLISGAEEEPLVLPESPRYSIRKPTKDIRPKSPRDIDEARTMAQTRPVAKGFHRSPARHVYGSTPLRSPPRSDAPAEPHELNDILYPPEYRSVRGLYLVQLANTHVRLSRGLGATPADIKDAWKKLWSIVDASGGQPSGGVAAMNEWTRVAISHMQADVSDFRAHGLTDSRDFPFQFMLSIALAGVRPRRQPLKQLVAQYRPGQSMRFGLYILVSTGYQKVWDNMIATVTKNMAAQHKAKIRKLQLEAGRREVPKMVFHQHFYEQKPAAAWQAQWEVEPEVEPKGEPPAEPSAEPMEDDDDEDEDEMLTDDDDDGTETIDDTDEEEQDEETE